MKTVLITGVGKGIGKALAEKFLAEGWSVIGTFYDAIIESRKNLYSFPLDLSKPLSIKDGLTQISELGINIDVLINNAGVLLDEDEISVVNDKLRATLEVNLIGTINFTEQIIPLLGQGAHIINISSSAGSLSLPVTHDHNPYHYPSYKISKTAVNMYTKTLAARLKDKNIIVYSVHTGWVKTDMGGPDADMEPQEAAEHIFKLAVSDVETGNFWFKGEKLPW